MAEQPAEPRAALEAIAIAYREAYVAHDPSLAPLAPGVRFSENNVELRLPDGTWDAVSEELGPALTVVDVNRGTVGIFTAIRTLDTPGFLAIRLSTEAGQITECEHIFSTARNLSGPPTPIGDVADFRHNPLLSLPLDPADRAPEDVLVALADGYWSTLENNTGEIRGTDFTEDCIRFENGRAFPDAKALFQLGRYRFNERVRDRAFLLVDEERGLVMSRAFIDHKGLLDEFQLTDGREVKSIFREPHSWHMLELFRIASGKITAIEATFIAVPYFMPTVWS
ncbi:MAG TPA: hypothetical protein VIJ34_09230 [Acidimicrobiales bacterium]